MARLIQELGDTKTGDFDSSVQSEVWAKKVIHYGESLRKATVAFQQNTDLVGSNDKTIHLPATTGRSGSINWDVAQGASGTADSEGTARDYSTLGIVDGVDITISPADFEIGGIAISKQAAMTTNVDLVKEARYQIGQKLKDTVDNAIFSATVADGTGGDGGSLGGTVDAANGNLYYGGDATSADEVADGDTITTDLVADAMSGIEANDFMPKYLFIRPEQIKAFRKDGQFTNAAEYGSDQVIQNGEIGNYLGIKIIVSTNVPHYSAGGTDTNEQAAYGTTSSQSTVCPMYGVSKEGNKVTGVLAWKEKPHIDYAYNKDEAEHRIFLDQAYTTSLVYPGAVSLIKVTDS